MIAIMATLEPLQLERQGRKSLVPPISDGPMSPMLESEDDSPRASIKVAFAAPDKAEGSSLLLPHPLIDEPRTDGPKYNDESISSAFQARVGWLGLFLVGLWCAAFVIDAFEHTLQSNVELAHFVPLIIGQGGNAGTQAVSSVIRALAGKEIDPRSHATSTRVLVKESVVGALCGLVLGVSVLGVGLLFRIVSVHVGVVVAISLPLVSLW